MQYQTLLIWNKLINKIVVRNVAKPSSCRLLSASCIPFLFLGFLHIVTGLSLKNEGWHLEDQHHQLWKPRPKEKSCKITGLCNTMFSCVWIIKMLPLLLTNLRKQIFKDAYFSFPNERVKWANRISFNWQYLLLCSCSSPYSLDLVLCLETIVGGWSDPLDQGLLWWCHKHTHSPSQGDQVGGVLLCIFTTCSQSKDPADVLSFGVFESYCLYLKKYLSEWQDLLYLCTVLSSRLALWHKWFYFSIRPCRLCLVVSDVKLNSAKGKPNGQVLS